MFKKNLAFIITGIIMLVIIAVIIVISIPAFQKNQELSSMAGTQMDNMAMDVKASNYENQSSNMTVEALESTEKGKNDNGIKDNLSIKKIIKDANITLETKVIDNDFNKVVSWVEKNGGYEFSRDVNFNGEFKQIRVVFKVPPQKLNAFIDFLASIGKLSNSSISSNDITDQYYDTAARLENLKNGRNQLLEVQKKAVTITDILKVQNELNTITGQIESLEGSIKMWDKLTGEATVNISMFEQKDPVKPTEEIKWDFSSPANIWKAMKNGFIWTINAIFSVIIWVLIALVTLSPVIVIVVIVIIVVRIMRKNKKEE
ncbi:MAG: DUF4349 domain-containing protein [Ignavibacteriales bacterium]